MRVDVTAEHSGGGVASTVAESAFEAALAEADRLDETLSQFRPDSAFNRWRQGDGPAPAELVAILEAAQRWFELSEGAFHPGLGRVVERWRAAERLGILPHPAEIAALAARPLPFTARNASLSTRGDLGAVDIHGIAKGWVVDRMLDAALTIDGVEAAMVDLGGDIAHGGSPEHPVRIAVEHPFDVADNARALTTIRLGRQAIATSAGGRRGFNVAGQWLGHLIDPRSGWPLPGTRSCTAIAATAADADAAASAGAVRGCDGGGRQLPFRPRVGTCPRAFFLPAQGVRTTCR